MRRVYADNAATTKMCPESIAAMLPYFDTVYGNPSSLHSAGQEAAQALSEARKTIAKLIGADEREIYFTSGGSEADNWAILSAAKLGAKKGRKHIVSTKFEHHAVLHTLTHLEKEGFEVTYLDVYSDGIVRTDDVKQVLREDTALVTVMYANNEIGTSQPIREIGTLCREKGIPFHTDAVQAAGHVPINVGDERIDMLSISAHKFHGPKGIGVLYCRRGVPLLTFLEGGSQERGKRAGTENVAAIVGMAVAFEKSCLTIKENSERISSMRNKLIEGLTTIPRTRLNGSKTQRLPGNVSVCFEGVEGEALLLSLDLSGICGSSGSACTSGLSTRVMCCWPSGCLTRLHTVLFVCP
jgi:cysteine desulfurase